MARAIKSAWEILQSKHAFSVEGRYDSFEYVITTDDAIEMAKEYAEQFIDLAANNATLKELRGQEFQESNDSVINSYGESYGVDKESILILKEQIK